MKITFTKEKVLDPDKTRFLDAGWKRTFNKSEFKREDIQIGKSFLISDHAGFLSTSKVVAVNWEKQTFETENSIYKWVII